MIQATNIQNIFHPVSKLQSIQKPKYCTSKYPTISNELSSPQSHELIKPKRLNIKLIFTTYCLVMRFAKALKNSISAYSNKKKLSLNAFSMINDMSAIYQNYRNNARNSKFSLEKLYIKINKASSHISIITYSSNFNKILRVLSCIIIIINFIFIPLNLTFYENHKEFSQYIKIFSLIWFIFDILIKMNTEIKLSGDIIKERTKIQTHYLKKYLKTDLLSLIPLTLNIYFDSLEYYSILYNIIFYIKIKELKKITNKLLKEHSISEYCTTYTSILNTLGLYLLITHSFACLWVFMAKKQSFYLNSWFSMYDLLNEDWKIQYILSLKMVFQIFFFQGQTEYDPKLTYEVLCYLFFLLIAMLLLFRALKDLILIVLSQKEQNKDLCQIYAINKYLKEKDIKPELKLKIKKKAKNFIHYQHYLERKLAQTQILENMPLELKEKLNEKIFEKIVKKAKFLTIFSNDTLRKMQMLFKEIEFQPGDLIYAKDTDPSLYYIGSGEVSFNFIANSVIFKRTSNELFGEQEFFTGFPQKLYAVALKKTLVFSLNRKDFITLLNENRTDYEKFCHIKDKISIEGNLLDLEYRCNACGLNENHNEINCPSVHYISKNKKIKEFYKEIEFSEQERRNYQRNREKMRRKVLLKKKESIIKNSINMHHKNCVEEEESEIYSDMSINVSDKDFFGVNTFDLLKINEDMSYFPEYNIENCIINANKNRKKIEKIGRS